MRIVLEGWAWDPDLPWKALASAYADNILQHAYFLEAPMLISSYFDLTCYGQKPAFAAGTSDRGHAEMQLAEYCWRAGSVGCQVGTGNGVYNSQSIFMEFTAIADAIEAIQQVDGLVEIEPPDLFAPGHFSRVNVKIKQRIAEFCYIKCICQPEGRANSPPTPLDRTIWQNHFGPRVGEEDLNSWNEEFGGQKVLEWNFDQLAGTIRDRQPGEIGYWQGMLFEAGFAHLYYVGADINRPVCDPQAVAAPLVEWIRSQALAQERYANLKQMCLHRYYGGSNFTNLGGLCTRDQSGRRGLHFHYEYKAPYFTGEFSWDLDAPINPWPAGVAAKQTLVDRQMDVPSRMWLSAAEYICSRGCSCSQDDEPEDYTASPIPDDESVTGPGERVRGGSMWAYELFQDRHRQPGQGGGVRGGLAGQPDRQAAAAPKCGGSCTSVADSSCSDSMCFCQATRRLDSPDNHLAAPFIGNCISLLTAFRTGGASTRTSGGHLGRRRDLAEEEKSPIEEESAPFICPCNGTYVSEACCVSGDGLVWEHTDLKLGELG
ncbi:MAG: hypothetical protein M1814_001474 [Vezdaea aestivalis]|nr:MAG: hypothetical protein M1814_001474 [Vezdaea aestivalis]